MSSTEGDAPMEEPLGLAAEYVLHRERFDEWLAEKAQSSGVQVLGHGVVETTKGPFSARSIVIGPIASPAGSGFRPDSTIYRASGTH